MSSGSTRLRRATGVAARTVWLGLLLLAPSAGAGEPAPAPPGGVSTTEAAPGSAVSLGTPARLELGAAAPEEAFLLGPLPARLELSRPLCGPTSVAWARPGDQPQTLLLDRAAHQPEWLTVKVAGTSGGCEQPRLVRLFFAGENPWRPPAVGLTLHVESGVAEVTSEQPEDYQMLAVREATVVHLARCRATRGCSMLLDEQLRRDWFTSDRTVIQLAPPWLPLSPGQPLPTLLDASGARLPWPDPGFSPARLVFLRPLIDVRQLSIASDHVVLPVALPGAVAEVSCGRARCTLGSEGIELFAVDPAALSVRVTMTLRPGVFRQLDGRLVGREVVEVPLVRCAVRQPRPVPLLAGVDNLRTYLWVGSECLTDAPEDLVVETQPPTLAFVESETPSPSPGWRLLEVVLQRVPDRVHALEMTLRRRDSQRTSLGALSIPVERDYLPVSVRLEVPGLGLVDFIPANREAEVQLAFDDPRLAAAIRPESRPGFYRIRTDAQGRRWIRAETGASGSVALRLGYAPVALAELLGRSETLGSFETEARYPLRTMNVPVPLTTAPAGSQPIVRVACRRGDREVDVQPGRTVSIPFAERNSCHIVIDRQAIPEEAGEQRLRIHTDRQDTLLSVAHQATALSISLPVGNRNEFDSLSLSVAHEYAGGQYDLSPRQDLGPEAFYRIVLGDRIVRVSASTALPTGLFRFGAKADRGAVPLSAGAKARIAWLYREGIEFPFGLELGLLSTGLSDAPDLSLVTGVGFSIPVLNAETMLETSFNIHAWLEYSPTRTADGQSHWAFLFGPSFTIGKFSANL